MKRPTGTKRARKHRPGWRGDQRRDRGTARTADARVGARIRHGRVRHQLRGHWGNVLGAAKRVFRKAVPRAAEVAMQAEALKSPTAAARNRVPEHLEQPARVLGGALFWIVTCGRQPPHPGRRANPCRPSASSSRRRSRSSETTRKATPPPRSIRPADRAVGRRAPAQLPPAAAAASALRRRRKRMEHRQMRRHLVAFGRIMRAPQAARARRSPSCAKLGGDDQRAGHWSR